MGSFNVSCSLSRLSISCGDRCAIVAAATERILNKGQNGDFVIPPSSMFIESEGFGLVPVTIPIWGTYDDYGNIEVEDNPKHEALVQEMYKCSLQELADCITRPFDSREDWPIKLKEQFPDGLFCIFFHGEAFDGAVEYMREVSPASKRADVDATMLEMLGFVENKEIKSPDKRYYRVFMHPKVKSYCLLSDGTWCHVYKMSKEKKDGSRTFTRAPGSTYSPSDLSNVWHILTGQYVSAYELDGVLATEMGVRKYARQLKQYDELYQEYIDRGESEAHAKNFATLMTDMRGDGRFMWGGYNTSAIKELYAPALRKNDEDIIQAIAEFKAVRGFMYLVSAMFLPTISGPQYGDYEATQELGRIISSASRNKIVERRY